jgi:hypothetical protein
MKKLAVLAILTAMAAGAMTVQAKEVASTKEAVKALSGVPAAELPATAAKVVMAAPKQARSATVHAVIRRVARTNPSALKHVVAEIAKTDASLASIAAAAASQASPDSVGAIAAAACTAAPERAAEILAVCSRVTVVGRGSLAQMVATINPAFSASTLAQQSATVDLTVVSEAAGTTGGTVIVYPPGQGGSGGLDMQGNPIESDPTGTTGGAGSDDDRYGQAGS